MPIKKDETGKRWVEMEFLTPGTPEQVWEAMATGPGNAAWFTRGEIEGRVGGEFKLEFAPGMSTSGEVTFWEPPRRFGYVEHGWAQGAPPVATEITITGRAGDKCVVRMVHSLFASTDDWDDQLEGFESGWPGFFAVLRTYLAHFAGQKADVVGAMAPTGSDLVTSWSRLLNEIGYSGANVGERREGTGEPEALSGIVEMIHQEPDKRGILVRLDGPSPGIALIGAFEKAGFVTASVTRYIYGENARDAAASLGPRWREWLPGAIAAKA